MKIKIYLIIILLLGGCSIFRSDEAQKGLAKGWLYEVWVIQVYYTDVKAKDWNEAREKGVKNWKKDTTRKNGEWEAHPAIGGYPDNGVYLVKVIGIYQTVLRAKNWKKARKVAVKYWHEDTTSKYGRWSKEPAIQGYQARDRIMKIRKEEMEKRL